MERIKELRERTGAGIMDCKAALAASNNDLEQAVDFLRKKGMAQAAKRAGREAKEGLVVSKISGKKAALVEVNCETDFVARTEDFRKLANLALEETLAQGEKALTSDKISQCLAELSGKIGEKLVVRRAKVIETPKGTLFSYIHSNQKLGILLEMESQKDVTLQNADFQELGKNLAMQVAASNPLCLDRAGVPADVLEREKGIYREEIKGKPEAIVEKILQGKLAKFYQGSCLLEQPFIKDDKVSVKDLIAQAEKKIGDAIQVKRFVRFQLGETVAA